MGWRLEFNKEGSLEQNREKLVKLLSETAKALKNFLWNVIKIEKLMGCWNWFMLLVEQTMSVLEKSYKLA